MFEELVVVTRILDSIVPEESLDLCSEVVLIDHIELYLLPLEYRVIEKIPHPKTPDTRSSTNSTILVYLECLPDASLCLRSSYLLDLIVYYDEIDSRIVLSEDSTVYMCSVLILDVREISELELSRILYEFYICYLECCFYFCDVHGMRGYQIIRSS